MTKRVYESARTVIYDPVASNRNATRASLHSLGFRRVELVPTLDLLAKHLNENWPDLLLAEVAGAETEVCDLLQSVRQGALGSNPFIVMIATTWNREGSVITKALNSGADDLVARPFSTSVLGERIKLLTDRRKEFVVTSDYIGPDRRRDPSRPGAECVPVPNSLRVRTLDGLPQEEAERRIFRDVEHGKEVINAQKVRRDTVQLCIQWRMLEQRGQGTREFFDILTRIDAIAGGIKRRAAGTDQSKVDEHCTAVETAVQAINLMRKRSEAGGGEPAPDFMPPLHQLGHAALSLGKMLAPDETGPAKLAEFDAMIAKNQFKAA